MSEERIENAVRGFIDAYTRRDVEKMLSFLTEDVIWVLPDYPFPFKGKEEVKRYLIWETQRMPDFNNRDAGIGIMVKGNRAVHEQVFGGSVLRGRRFREIPGIAVYEFSGEKIQLHRMYYDRLSTCKQVARGLLERRIVGTIVNRWEKGLH